MYRVRHGRLMCRERQGRVTVQSGAGYGRVRLTYRVRRGKVNVQSEAG